MLLDGSYIYVLCIVIENTFSALADYMTLYQ